jgi:D-3-phosphoglycerate dehydrogenase
VGQISTRLAEAGLNIIEMLNRSRGEYAYTLIDVETTPSAELISTLAAIEGVITVRSLTLSTANGQ